MKQITVFAKAVFEVPDEAEFIEAYDGAFVGITVNGHEYRPIIGLDDGDIDGPLLVTDAQLRAHGMQCIEYLEAGVESDE